jgi:SAM-dependent methyltransferase
LRWMTNPCWCGAPGPGRALFEARDHNQGATDAVGRVMRCGSCGALFPDRFPTPASLPDAYRGYYTDRPRPRRRFGPRALLNRTRRDYLRRALPEDSIRVLDFGCGSGAFLALVASVRPDTKLFGTDFRPPPPGLTDFEWLAPGALEAAAPFDWITLGHVIEHVADPAALVSRLAGLLAPGGGLWISTPNADGFLTGAAGCWSRDIDFPRHRAVFTRGALGRLLADYRLEAVDLPSPRLNAALTTVATLANIARDRAQPPWGRAWIALNTVFGLFRYTLEPPRDRRVSSPELVLVCRRAD